MKTLISTTCPKAIRELSDDPSIKLTNLKLFPAKADGHSFAVGETRELTGLVDFPEYNGQKVEIESIRQSEGGARAYYIKGEITKYLNWVYENRLK